MTVETLKETFINNNKVIVNKTYDNGNYAIFELLCINEKYGMTLLIGRVLGTNEPTINGQDEWNFGIAGCEVVEVK